LAIGIVLPLVAAVLTIFGSMDMATLQVKGISGPLAVVSAIGVLACGGMACWCLRPRHGGPLQLAARRAVLLLGLGTIVLGGSLVLVSLSEVSWVTEIAAAEGIGVGLVLGLIGMRRVLVEAGQRCRLFRTSTIDRQRIAPLVLASLLAMLLLGAWVLAISMRADTAVLILASLWAAVSALLALGLGYLFVNAWWIRKDLRSPPPKLSALLQAKDD
jgi:hypothetical protein